MKLFGKSALPTLAFGAALSALIANESASAEQVDAANAELDAAGITGAQLVPGATLDELTAQAARTTTAEAATATATARVTALEAELATANGELTTARTEVARLGKLGGASHTNPALPEGKSDVDDERTASEKMVADLHAKMLGE